MRPSRLIDPTDRLRIEAAVVEAEKRTRGEIVVVVARACDEYGSAGWRLGVALAAIGFLALALLAPDTSAARLLAAQAAGLGAGHLLARADPIRRRLISRELAEARVGERARRAFAENGLTRTRERNGILIFVALLERRVSVLADEGIDGAVAPGESWQDVVDRVLEGLRRGEAARGLVAAVERCGEILAAHVPAAERNPDELPNAVVLED